MILRQSDFNSLAYAQARRGCAGRRTFRAVCGAARAHKSRQDLVIFTGDRAGAGDDASCRRARSPRRARWPLRSGPAALATRSCRALCASLALRALRSDGARRSRRPGWTALADGTLRTNRPLRALCALRTGRTDRPGRTRRPRWTLQPWLTAASRQRDDRDGGRHAQHLSHRHFSQPDAKTALFVRLRSSIAVAASS